MKIQYKCSDKGGKGKGKKGKKSERMCTVKPYKGKLKKGYKTGKI